MDTECGRVQLKELHACDGTLTRDILTIQLQILKTIWRYRNTSAVLSVSKYSAIHKAINMKSHTRACKIYGSFFTIPLEHDAWNWSLIVG